MDSRTIRDRFLAFFAEREHQRVPSSSLVPNDPTLLLTGAGMIQFKPYFLGEQSPPYKRATTVQKCFRTTDVDLVGTTSRHLTFFEMLGNFSFGDYYKEKAAPWAWELVTEGYGIDPEHLWVTVYETDDEAEQIWIEQVGVRPERVVRRGGKDNFWDMGVAGPCGPCSEVYVDLGERFGPASDLGPEGNEDRYLEIWNLVFMQNDCNERIEPVAELPKKNIDTGAGLERIALFLQGAASVFETDVLGAMLAAAQDLTKKEYGEDSRTDMGLRILADHGRGISFLIADGVLPANEERGYVLRRMMRRTIRHSRLLGREEAVLPQLIETTVELMGDAYPELKEKRDFIVEVAEREGERFAGTLRQGLTMLEDEIARARDLGTGIPGDSAFMLHDTYGFPIDLTREIAEEAGLDVDSERFETLMAEQRQRARAARKTEGGEGTESLYGPVLEEHGATDFQGYEHLSGTGRVLAIADGTRSQTVASQGDEVDIVLDRTVFYAEGGGQVGDSGMVAGPGGEGRVVTTRRLVQGLTGHRVQVTSGEIAVGDELRLQVDPAARREAERAHTATHVLHWILRDRLGEHATQAGSLVEPGRLRFDFNHYEALSDDLMDDIGGELQGLVMTDDGVRAFETSFDLARSIGAMAIFGEKYGDFVRVVEVGDYSKELCGGTHVAHTSQIGPVVLTSEGSVGANLRRIEALVGHHGLDYLIRRTQTLETAAQLLKAGPDEVVDRLERLLVAQKELERKVVETERKSAEASAGSLVKAAPELNGTKVIVAQRDDGIDALRALAQQLKSRLDSAVIVFGRAGDGKGNLVAALTKDLVDRGLTAQELLAPGAELLGGGAGGKPDLAMSGGPAADRLDDALRAVEDTIRARLGA